ncbi:MAG: efflux RND transporter periplasmic adaptor subunit [Candidatus Dactylopiibacterium sp.]|nr:efflux RND transporter periplasmic adaptor subunit [Candidatus Dactylopiibacterium sp.]
MLRSSLALLLPLFGLLAACQKEDAPVAQTGAAASVPAARSGTSQTRAQNVSTTVSRVENVPLRIEAQGNVLALDEVDIRAQKNGTVTAIHFREGDDLRRGQLLFSLDARDDTANVAKATAGVASAEAGAAIAQRDLARTQELFDRKFVAASALDTGRNKLDTATAALAQARAALEQARVSASYNEVRAPFDGRAGVINVRVGSLVTSSATATALVHLTRMNPIGVSFAISERDMPPLLEALQHGKVRLTATTNTGEALEGEVNFVDNTVERSSGTLLVKGQLDNTRRRVWPGQFVNVAVEAGEMRNAVVLPSQAVVNGPNNRFVYVVKDDHTVEMRPVQLLRIVDQKAVVTGIPEGLKVVLEGTQNLRPGVSVHESGNPEGGKARHGKAKPAEAK